LKLFPKKFFLNRKSEMNKSFIAYTRYDLCVFIVY